MILTFTDAEQDEMSKLSKQLFKGNSFVVFSDEEKASPEFKRYDELMAKKMKFLAAKRRAFGIK